MAYETTLKRKNPWERELQADEDYYNTPDVERYLNNDFFKCPKFLQKDVNRGLDVEVKKAALLASPFLVSLISYTGEEELNQSSGFIFATDETNTAFVFTSASLIRKPTAVEDFIVNEVANDQKVHVQLANGTSYECMICASDFYYNLATLSFKSEAAVTCAPIKRVDESLDINPKQGLRSHSSSVSLTPGHVIVGLGRYFAPPYELMAAPGVYCIENCDYECKELFYATCKMTSCGDGGPVINLAGDVVGVAFYNRSFTPFLPINIACKWWELRKKNREFRRPFMGIEATNFYAADLNVIEKIIRTFPNISKGVIVEKVIPDSVAKSSDLHMFYVIIRCGGKTVSSFLEFMEIIMENVGQIVEMDVARGGSVSLLHPKMMISSAFPSNS